MTSGEQPGRPYRAIVRTMLRDRLLDAAAGAFADDGWRRLTMARVASTLSARGTLKTLTLPAIEVDDFIAAMDGGVGSGD